MLRILLFCLSAIFFAYAADVNFDFVDARKKGYSDTEILDYVLKNFTGSDISSLRQAGISDKEIVDFYIQKDVANSQLRELSKEAKQSRTRVYPEEVSSKLALGCKVYNGQIKQNDGWRHIADLIDFATAIYTAEYLKQANYFNIEQSQGVSLKNICATWLDRLQTKEEINKLYALSLVNEIAKLVQQRQALVLQ